VIAAPRAKKTSGEVAAAAKCKADLQHQADELEQQHIETLAEMDLEEELDDKAEEHSIVRKLADAYGLDGVDDVEMWSDNNGDISVADADSHQALESDSDEAVAENKVAQK